MTAIEFLRRYRPNSLVKSSARGEYQLAEHDSFKINGESSVWHWKSRDIGGRTALKYLIYVEGVPFVEAVQLLCEESPMYIPVQHEAVERERPPFRLPNPAPNNDRVTRYLLGRGISLPTIRYCIARKILYESAEYHNCVFLGKDPQGVPKYAALRGIYDYGKPFKREAPGSQKQYGFCIPPMQPGTTVAVFEAAIDAMAEMTLCGDAADKYRSSDKFIATSLHITDNSCRIHVNNLMFKIAYNNGCPVLINNTLIKADHIYLFIYFFLLTFLHFMLSLKLHYFRFMCK